MNGAKKTVIMIALVLVFTLIFCGICMGFSKAPAIFDNFTPETEEVTEWQDEEMTAHEHYHVEETTEETEPETTVTEPETTKKPTTVPATKYDFFEMKEILVSRKWSICLNGTVYNLRLYENCTFEIYDEYGEVYLDGRYSLDGNCIRFYNFYGIIEFIMEYDEAKGTFCIADSADYGSDYDPGVTVPQTEGDKGLDNSNAVDLLWDAVYCYDGFLNTTTYNLEYDYFGECITCPHCGEKAYLVENFSSRTELERYIDSYLCGESKETAEYYLDYSFSWDMLTERYGKLYVCGAYNDRGYCGIDNSTIRVLRENADGSYTIAVDDYDLENTYYLDVYYIDGEYKIG